MDSTRQECYKGVLYQAGVAPIGHDMTNEVGGEGGGSCSECDLSFCGLGVVHDLARDKGEGEREFVMESDAKLVNERLSRYLMARTVHKDVMDVVQRCGQTGPTCRMRARRVVHFLQLLLSTLLRGKAVGSEPGPDRDHGVALHREEQGRPRRRLDGQ